MKILQTPFNVKSCYSFLQSTIRLHDYVNYGIKQHVKYLSLIENNVFTSQFAFWQLCQKNNIKAIIGFSFYIKINQEIVSVAVICKNNDGYFNANRLSTLLHQKRMVVNDYFCLSAEDLLQYSKGLLIVITPKIDTKNKVQFDNCFNLIQILKNNQVSSDQIFIGINFKNLHEIFLIKQRCSHLKLIWFQECYALNSDDFETLVTLKAIKDQQKYQDIIENDIFIDHLRYSFWVKTEEQQQKIDSCNINNDFKQSHQALIDAININLQPINAQNNLKNLCHDAKDNPLDIIQKKCNARLASLNFPSAKLAKYQKRLQRELVVIHKMKFEVYFLIVADYVNYAKNNNIYIGPGRGSAASSLVSYLLNITIVDPLKYDLIFERFLNEERYDWPDIDIDVEDMKRKDIILYLQKKYHYKNVALINTFANIGFKNAVRDVGRVFNYDLKEINKICNLVNIKQNDQFELIMKDKYLQKLQAKNQAWTNFFEIVKKIIGLPRQEGTHAAGILIANQALENILPLSHNFNLDNDHDILKTQLTMESLNFFGIIKFDLLGLKNLTILHEIVDSINATQNKSISLEKIPLDGPETFKLLQQGDTFGIFQLESDGMTNILTRLNPDQFEDIVTAISLFRPGAMENADRFINSKMHKIKIDFIHDDLKVILKNTYGVILYQEQVMLIAQKIANFPLTKADILRKAMGKKNLALMSSIKTDFFNGAQQNNYNPELIKLIWHFFEKFAGYGFNRSHAVSYGLIGYWLSYFKAYYFNHFICALLNSVIKNETKTSFYLTQARKRKIKIHAPSIEKPIKIFKTETNNILLPLSIIKGIGNVFLRKIIKAAPFGDLYYFVNKFLNKGLNDTTYYRLVGSGALQVLTDLNRTSLLDKNNWEILKNYGKIKLDYKTKGQPTLKHIPQNYFLEINAEKEAYGFYLSKHPILHIRNNFSDTNKLIKINELEKFFEEQQQITKHQKIIAYIIGTIDDVRTKLTRNNKKMAFLVFSDESGKISLTVFPGLFDKYNNIFLNIDNQFFFQATVMIQLYNNRLTYQLLSLTKQTWS